MTRAPISKAASLRIALALLSASAVHAQPAPLNLPYLIEQASASHPSMQSARIDARASDEDLQAVQRQRWPTISAVIEDGKKNTISPAARVIRVEQNIWDFGRVGSRIAESEISADTAKTRVNLQQQLLALQAVNAWQSLLASHAKVAVAEATLSKLSGYRMQMQRRIVAEVSPAIDLELVQSRMLQTQVELTGAQTSVKTALTKLEQVSGVNGLGAHLSKLPALPGLDATSQIPAQFSNFDWTLAAKQHPAVTKARLESEAAEFRAAAKQAEKWPELYARVDRPIAGTPGKTACVFR